MIILLDLTIELKLHRPVRGYPVTLERDSTCTHSCIPWLFDQWRIGLPLTPDFTDKEAEVVLIRIM